MNRRRRRTNPNRSYLRLVRLYMESPATWVQEDKVFVDEMEQLINELCESVPKRCQEGRVDALFLQFERCRFESEKLRAQLSIEADSVICPEWLAECLRAHLEDQWFKTAAGKGKRNSPEGAGMKSLYENLASTDLEFNLPLTRGAVLPAASAQHLCDYLVRKLFEGTAGLRGRHSTPDERVTDLFKHYHRYSVIEDLRERGRTLENARLEAPNHVPDGANLGSTYAFEKSHKLVARSC